jgi:hypothetical protein
MPFVVRLGRLAGNVELLEDGFALATRLQAEVDLESLPYVLTLDIGVLHGRPICLSLRADRRAGGSPVTRSGLATIPVERLVLRAAVEAGGLRAESQDGVIVVEPLTEAEQTELARRLRPRRGRRADPAARRQLMEQVVQQYRDLTRAQVKKPKPDIASNLAISQSYVGALLAQARREGLLGPAAPGRAGETEDPQPGRKPSR